MFRYSFYGYSRNSDWVGSSILSGKKEEYLQCGHHLLVLENAFWRQPSKPDECGTQFDYMSVSYFLRESKYGWQKKKYSRSVSPICRMMKGWSYPSRIYIFKKSASLIIYYPPPSFTENGIFDFPLKFLCLPGECFVEYVWFHCVVIYFVSAITIRLIFLETFLVIGKHYDIETLAFSKYLCKINFLNFPLNQIKYICFITVATTVLRHYQKIPCFYLG